MGLPSGEVMSPHACVIGFALVSVLRSHDASATPGAPGPPGPVGCWPEPSVLELLLQAERPKRELIAIAVRKEKAICPRPFVVAPCPPLVLLLVARHRPAGGRSR